MVYRLRREPRNSTGAPAADGRVFNKVRTQIQPVLQEQLVLRNFSSIPGLLYRIKKVRHQFPKRITPAVA